MIQLMTVNFLLISFRLCDFPFAQKLHFKVKDNNNFMDETLGEAVIDVDDYVAKGQKTNVSLSNGGSILVQKTTPIKFRLYAR